MPVNILLPDGVERLLPLKGRLHGHWETNYQPPFRRKGFYDFPHLFFCSSPRHSIFQQVGWPCWMGASCWTLFIWPGEDNPNKVLEDDSFHWAMRLTGLLEMPIDYDAARLRIQIRLLDMLADFDMGEHSSRMKGLLEARLDGRPNGFEVAREMLSAYRFYQEAWDAYSFPDDNYNLAEIIQVGSAISCLQPDDMIDAVIIGAMQGAMVRAWHRGERDINRYQARSFERQDKQAAPYILKIRQALLKSLRESVSEISAIELEPVPGCTGGFCDNCVDLFWDTLEKEMSPVHRAELRARRSGSG